ncbi:MAG: hypothetical protein K9M75_05860 [Phycisphaerae bacterium]|nr:hypothetical protein [Phycisphaerae bacterium]
MIDETGFENPDLLDSELDQLDGLIENSSNNQDHHIALSLAFSALCYDFGYRNYQHYVTIKKTPLTEVAKKHCQEYLPIDKNELVEFSFDVDEKVVLLGEIKKTTSSCQAILLEKAINIFKEYYNDKCFIKSCNKDYLATILEITEGDRPVD